MNIFKFFYKSEKKNKSFYMLDHEQRRQITHTTHTYKCEQLFTFHLVARARVVAMMEFSFTTEDTIHT